jgi:hypothetical protein
LVSLELDMFMTKPYTVLRQADVHLCPHIAMLLPRLRYLTLRMRNLCPKILQTPDCSGPIPLKRLTIILGKFFMTPRGELSRLCHSPRESRPHLIGEIETEAAILSKRMANPKIVRLSAPHGGGWLHIDVPRDCKTWAAGKSVTGLDASGV